MAKKPTHGTMFNNTLSIPPPPPPAPSGTMLVATGGGGAEWTDVQETLRNRFFNDIVYTWDPIEPFDEARLPKVVGETFTVHSGDLDSFPRAGRVYIKCTIMVYCERTTHWRGGHPINFYDCTFIRFEPISVLEQLGNIEP